MLTLLSSLAAVDKYLTSLRFGAFCWLMALLRIRMRAAYARCWLAAAASILPPPRRQLFHNSCTYVRYGSYI